MSRRLAATVAAILSTGALTTAAFAAGGAAKLVTRGVYTDRGNLATQPSGAAADGVHVTLIAKGPTTIASYNHHYIPDGIESAVQIVCHNDNASVTPLVPKIALRRAKGHWSFSVARLPGVGVDVSMTGTVTSAHRIIGTIVVHRYAGSPCVGTWHYAAGLDPKAKPGGVWTAGS